MVFVLNTLVSALVIAGVALVSRKYPVPAGFLVALPIATMLVLPLAYLQHRDTASVLFWGAYALGCALLPIGYFVHRALMRAIG